MQRWYLTCNLRKHRFSKIVLRLRRRRICVPITPGRGCDRQVRVAGQCLPDTTKRVSCAAFDDAKNFLNSDEVTKRGRYEEERRGEKYI